MTDGDENTSNSLYSIFRGGSLHLSGKVIANAIAFFINILLTRTYGPALFGVFTFGKTIIITLSNFTTLGSDQTLLRFMPKYREAPGRKSRILGTAYGTAFLMSLVATTVLFACAPVINRLTLEDSLLVDVLRIFAISLPMIAIVNVSNCSFRAVGKVEYQVILSNIVKQVVQFALVLGAVWIGLSIVRVTSLIVASFVIVAALALYFLYTRTGLRMAWPSSMAETTEFYNFSIPLSFKSVSWLLYRRVDILMVGIFLSSVSVGIYRVAFLVTTILNLPLSAIIQLFPPIASDIYSRGTRQELNSLYSTVTRWAFTISLVPAITVIIYSQQILSFFGEGFREGNAVLIVFVIGQMAHILAGPSGFVLMMTDHQYLDLANEVSMGIVNVILNVLLIKEFGIFGAALATSIVFGCLNILRIIEIYYYESLLPYSTAFLKPMIAGGLAGVTMYGVSLIMFGRTALVVGVASGGIIFIFVLLWLGLEKDDRDLFRQIKKNNFLSYR